MFYDEELEEEGRDKVYEYEEESHTLNEAQQEQAELEWMEELRLRCYEKGRWEL
jgi:hypothetical protein